MSDFQVVGMREFNKEVERWSRYELPEKFGKGLRKIGIDFLSKFVKRTPVGNRDRWKKVDDARFQAFIDEQNKGYTGGRARGNWQVGINREPQQELDVTDKTGGQTRLKGRAIVESIPDALAIGTVIYITNNVPYIMRLEEGHSSVAPAGTIIALTITEMKAIFNEF